MNARCLASVVLFASLSSLARAQAPELPKPTPEHEALSKEVGVWDGEASVWMSPDAPPEKSQGVETNKMLGKFWLVSEYEGEMMGAKFTGRMNLGYDPVKKKYVGVWVDSISPHLQTVEGDYDDATRTLTMTMTGTDFMTGQPSTAKVLTRYVDADHKVFEMHAPGEGGKTTKVMETKYTRRK
jgi:hypothetical protein